jgi:hypothetical protein
MLDAVIWLEEAIKYRQKQLRGVFIKPDWLNELSEKETEYKQFPEPSLIKATFKNDTAWGYCGIDAKIETGGAIVEIGEFSGYH